MKRKRNNSRRPAKSAEWLCEHLVRVKRNLEIAETKASRVNEFIAQYAKVAVENTIVLLGPVLQARAYPPTEERTDSAEVIQAALIVPGGLGVLLWDFNHFQGFTPEGLVAEAPHHLIPFEECDLGLRSLLANQIDDLLRRLRETVLGS